MFYSILVDMPTESNYYSLNRMTTHSLRTGRQLPLILGALVLPHIAFSQSADSAAFSLIPEKTICKYSGFPGATRLAEQSPPV